MMIDCLDNRSIEEVLTYYENACITYCDALGHNKACFNLFFTERYAAELTARGEPVPDINDAAKKGTFNGIGAY